jgi:hypothetical protein
MKLKDYIENPLGGRITTHRDFYDNLYRGKFKNLLVRVNNKIDYKLYFTNKTYIIHIKMPSENVDGILYDIVIELYPTENHVSITDALENYDFRFFSNDPWFNYVYAHVFKEKNMLVKDLESKFSKEVFRQAPDTTNPNHQTGYIKYLYFAYLLIQQKHILSKQTFTLYGKAYLKTLLINDVIPVDEMIDKRRTMGEKQRRNNKKQEMNAINPQNKNFMTKTIDSVKSINTVKSNHTIGKTGAIKKSKRI